MSTRKASHAGSWYTENGQQLSQELDQWMAQADTTNVSARAIIAPHAGYSYSGPTAAFAYKQIDPTPIKRVFIMGPSHHFYLPDSCALSSAKVYETPLYNLTIDQDVYKQLRSTGQFQEMSMRQDEDEHSIEMHLAFVAKVMQSKKQQFTIVPILVGSQSASKEAEYGAILAPYLAQPENLFVISSDFCHWGKRFSYVYCDDQPGDIWQSIERLDKRGMKIIEGLEPSEFTAYLQATKNTICGRHPIGVLLNAVANLRQRQVVRSAELRFVRYAQSSKCFNNKDSSVSYASAYLTLS